jgi:hypothetical protein
MSLGLQDSYVKLLEWSAAAKAKKIEVLTGEGKRSPEKEISRRVGFEQ